mgnify:CR=1 FL=1
MGIRNIEYLHKNVTGNTATVLIEKDTTYRYEIQNMTICNKHSSDAVVVDLFLRQRIIPVKPEVELDNDFTSLTTTFSEVYLAKNVTIDFGTTLVLESNELDFDSTVFDFVIKLNNSKHKKEKIICGKYLEIKTI